MKSIWITALILFLGFTLHAQKPALSSEDYNIWKTLKTYLFSDDGTWLSYEISPYRGDHFGVIMKSDSSLVKEFPRFSPAKILGDGNFIIGSIKPQFDTLRKLELDKVKKDKWPKDSLLVYNTSKDSVIKIPNIIDYKFAPNGLWLAFRNQDQSSISANQESPKKKTGFFSFLRKTKKVEEEKIESDGKVLTFWHPGMHRKFHVDYVTAYELSDSASYLALVQHQKKDKKDSYTLSIHQFSNNTTIFKSEEFTQIGKLTWDKTQKNFAFLASEDTNSNNRHFSLYHLTFGEEVKSTRLDSIKIAHTEDYIPSNFGQLSFAEDGARLFFGLAPKPVYDEKDSLTADEKVKLDLWHWQDKKLQPRQLLTAKRDKNKSYLSYYDWTKDEIHQIENDTLKVRFNPKQTRVFLATNDEPYSVHQDHEYPWRSDEYLIQPQANYSLERPYPLKKSSRFGSSLAPDGAYVVSYKEEKNEFILLNTQNKSVTCLSCDLDTDWFEDLNGQIYDPMPYVRFFWENDRQHVWLWTEFDIFRVNLETSKSTRITEKIGHDLKQTFQVVNWDEDSLYINPERCWLQGFSMLSKESNVYSLENLKPVLKMNKFANISSLQKNKNTDQISYRISTVATYPDLILDNTDFSTPNSITDVNPQQADYNWAQVELVEWKTKDDVALEGLLYTPENLDPNGSYPMIVYYYELNSDNLHRHWTPRPTASIVFPTEYVSGGYVVFVPDIRYKPGHPAQSAYDCIMSGTDHVLANYPFIDSTRMGLQGQSWGGYQTAQLITMTNRYKAAMAGAPVSNMFSAYGGIRWGSGMSRQFQYEHTQSRIGATIWEKPELYTLNSPLFGLPRVSTPLLIMHNDNDGAVPWYQGIELFMGLRRLQKPVWMLNYNEDEHNLMKEANRRDLSIRMRAFFDYYLNNGELPEWMDEGINAVDK